VGTAFGTLGRRAPGFVLLERVAGIAGEAAIGRFTIPWPLPQGRGIRERGICGDTPIPPAEEGLRTPPGSIVGGRCSPSELMDFVRRTEGRWELRELGVASLVGEGCWRSGLAQMTLGLGSAELEVGGARRRQMGISGGGLGR
jgi:hypothetical protein